MEEAREYRVKTKTVYGKPIIAWSIEAAIKSKCQKYNYKHDDEEIGEVARSYGVEMLFKRPSRLSDDYTGTKAVMKHAINTLTEMGIHDNDSFCCLYATAPFIDAKDLISAMNMAADVDKKCMIYAGTEMLFRYKEASRLTKMATQKLCFQKKLKKGAKIYQRHITMQGNFTGESRKSGRIIQASSKMAG